MHSERSAKIKKVLSLEPHIHLIIAFIHGSGCIPADELKFVMNNLPGHVKANSEILENVHWNLF